METCIVKIFYLTLNIYILASKVELCRNLPNQIYIAIEDMTSMPLF